jgi:Phytanoyl-CoA dioxygenase (PhyH)
LPAQPETLSPGDLQSFHDNGYVVAKGAFAHADAEAMQAEWWAELTEAHAIQRDDRATWRAIQGDLKQAKTSPIQERIATERVRGVIDDLLGAGKWRTPADWGRALVTFPETGVWDVPAELWHWDSPGDLHRQALNALFVVSFIGEVAPRSGGTLILSGSPRLLARHEAAMTAEQRSADAWTQRRRFHASHPWLMALTRKASSPADRVAAFMGAEADLDGIAARVVELTGEPGDMVFCHPTMVHCVAPNHGSRPRFMRIKQQVMTDEGRRLVTGARRPR